MWYISLYFLSPSERHGQGFRYCVPKAFQDNKLQLSETYYLKLWTWFIQLIDAQPDVTTVCQVFWFLGRYGSVTSLIIVCNRFIELYARHWVLLLQSAPRLGRLRS